MDGITGFIILPLSS